MNSISSYLLVLVGLLFLSCQKDKLKGDKEILIGAWEWQYTERTNNLCNPPSFEETLTPLSAGHDYRMEFEKKGLVRFYEDSNLKYERKIVFKEFYYYQGTESPVFSIYLDNNESDIMIGQVFSGGDSLFTWSYPYNFPNYDPDGVNCEQTYNMFYKVN